MSRSSLQAIQIILCGAGFCPADGVDQPPVVLADAKAAQCGFCGVVVQGDFTVFQKHTQILFLVQGVSKGFPGSVLIFVSMTFILIPEAGCGQSPQSLVNTGNSGNSLCWKSWVNRISKTQN